MRDTAQPSRGALEYASFQSFIDAHRLSGFQATLFAMCFLVAAIDGFDVALIGFLAPAISKSLKLSAVELAPIFGAGQFGAVAGALLIGPLADRFGRKRLMIWSTVGFGLMTAASAYAPDLRSLVALRFLTGVGLGGALPCATALTAEFCPERKRATLTTAMFCGFTFGSATGGFVTAWAEPIFGWREVVMWSGFVPLLLVPAIAVLVPESIEYLQRSTSTAARMDYVFRRIAGPRYDKGISVHRIDPAKVSPISDLFKARPLRGIVLLWATSFMTLLVVYLLSSWMPTMLTSKGVPLQDAAIATAMFQVGGTLGAVMLGLLMDRLRPNIVLAFAFALAAIFVGLLGQIGTHEVLVPVFIFLAGVCISGGQVGVMAYTAAWYPPHVRASGVSWTSASGRTGSIVGSFAGGGLIGLGLGYPLILLLLGLPCLLAAAFITLHSASGAKRRVMQRHGECN